MSQEARGFVQLEDMPHLHELVLEDPNSLILLVPLGMMRTVVLVLSPEREMAWAMVRGALPGLLVLLVKTLWFLPGCRTRCLLADIRA